MKNLTLQILADVTGGEYVGDEPGRRTYIKGAVRDNRDVRPGDLFVCIQGERVDGHSFANSAFASGAAACLAEKPIPDAAGPYILVESTLEALKKAGAYYRRQFDIPFIGITGSVGKTTTKELIAAVLGVRYKVLKTPANLNNEIGVPLTLLGLDDSYEIAVIEMGIGDFGEMSILAEIVLPDIMVITKIGYSHLETLGDLNGVLRAKSEVFKYMPSGGVAILSGDDSILRAYDPGMKKITFGSDPRCEYRAENIHTSGTDAVSFDVTNDSFPGFEVTIPSYGSHLAALAPAAVAAGRLFGMTEDDIRQGFLSYVPVGGRARVVHTGSITIIDDCYNSNPHSVMSALESLSELPGRHVAILGDMFELGALSDELHRKTGVMAADCNTDILLCAGDKAADIYEGFLSVRGAERGKDSRYYSDKTALINDLGSIIKKGDVVLVKASHAMGFEDILPHLRYFGENG